MCIAQVNIPIDYTAELSGASRGRQGEIYMGQNNIYIGGRIIHKGDLIKSFLCRM